MTKQEIALKELKHILRNDALKMQGIMKHMDKALETYNNTLKEEEK